MWWSEDIGLLFRDTNLRFGRCRQHLYNEARFSMRAGIGGEPTGGRKVFDSADPSFRIERRSDREIVVTTRYRGAHLSMVAGGDVNGDGLDDMLLETTRWGYDRGSDNQAADPAPGRKYGTGSKLFILSRDDPYGVLWVVNADDFLTSKKDCDDWRAATEWLIRQQ